MASVLFKRNFSYPNCKLFNILVKSTIHNCHEYLTASENWTTPEKNPKKTKNANSCAINAWTRMAILMQSDLSGGIIFTSDICFT